MKEGRRELWGFRWVLHCAICLSWLWWASRKLLPDVLYWCLQMSGSCLPSLPRFEFYGVLISLMSFHQSYAFVLFEQFCGCSEICWSLLALFYWVLWVASDLRRLSTSLMCSPYVVKWSIGLCQFAICCYHAFRWLLPSTVNTCYFGSRQTRFVYCESVLWSSVGSL